MFHSNIKDAAQCITSTSITSKNIIHIKYDLGFCDQCPECIIPDEELYDGPNASLIHFSIYSY